MFELAINGLYESGLTVFKSIGQPTPDEQRWGAVCYYNLNQYLEAKDLLELAQVRGCLGATIELATVLRLLGQPVEAIAQLDQLRREELSDHENALERRERGLLEYVQGDYKTALCLLEEAWSIIRRTDLRGPRSAVAQTLGFMFYAMGHNQQARYYLNRALEGASAARTARIRVTKAGCLVGLGVLNEAYLDLQLASESLEVVPALFGSFAYTSGLLARAQNRLNDALSHFDAAITFALQQPELETECYAQLQAAAVLMTLGKLDEVHSRLTRAQALVQSCGLKGKALLELRQGTLMSLSDDSAVVCNGIQLMKQARSGFAAMHFERGILLSDLYFAEAYLGQGNVLAARESLALVNDARLAMACTPALGELIHLPKTLAFLQTLAPGDVLRVMLEEWSNGSEIPPYRVELITFGKSKLRVNGKRIGLEIAGTVELIAYLLMNPNRTRDEILTALFAKKCEQQAANYFHQAKLTLQRATSVIEVLYDKIKKTYRVNCDIPMFVWDAIELQKLLADSDENRILNALEYMHGAFLADSDSDWAVAEREKMIWSVVKVGLETLDLWSKRGEYAKCLELAERLREIEPLNPVLAEYLVIATHSLEGEVAARRTLRVIEREFEREVGEIPEELMAIHSKLGLVN
jgi:tetratricopeptide (TPR) repeat protein